MAAPKHVQRDRPLPPGSRLLLVGRDDLPPEVQEAMRLVTATQVGQLQADTELALLAMQNGVEDLDADMVVRGLRKLLACGLAAKELADQMVRWSAP